MQPPRIVTYLVIITSLLVPGGRGHSDDQHWSYSHENKWGGVCRRGMMQSPIDISSSDTISKSAEPITFINYDKPGVTSYKVTEKSLSINVQHNCSYGITAGGLWGHYILHHIHLHFGAEHEIDGHQAEMEAHLVHYNSKYRTLEEAMNHPRGLAVIGVLFEKSFGDGSPIIDYLRTGFDLRLSQHSLLAPIRLLPEDRNHFYRYEGSLTTPPCNEVVVWTLMKDSLPITDTQVHSIQIYLQKSGLSKNNFRSVQKLNERRIFLYSTEYETFSSSVIVTPTTAFLLLPFVHLLQKI